MLTPTANLTIRRHYQAANPIHKQPTNRMFTSSINLPLFPKTFPSHSRIWSILFANFRSAHATCTLPIPGAPTVPNTPHTTYVRVGPEGHQTLRSQKGYSQTIASPQKPNSTERANILFPLTSASGAKASHRSHRSKKDANTAGYANVVCPVPSSRLELAQEKRKTTNDRRR